MAQRAHQLWLVHGDRNTRYFHTVVKRRRINNRITKIKDEQGRWVLDYSEIESLVVRYFQNVFTPVDCVSKDQIFHHLHQLNIPQLNPSHFESLNTPFTVTKIKDVVFQLHPHKSPGPNGLPAIFYQQLWPTVRSDIINMALSFLDRGYLFKSFNDTFITLILKISSPTTFKDFRPIGLCNVVYKILSKVLVNRLQSIMQDLITPFQNGFLKGQSIQDNIFLASELLTLYS